MNDYFNEYDPYAAYWIHRLQKRGDLPAGVVDCRDMHRVFGADLAEFTNVHFFAGIGGWAYALRLAGWPKDRPVWTGSCPCQPYSTAGKKLGNADPRNLWPEFRRIISECLPPTIFGEQVASAAGREWLSGVRADLEALGYAVGCADLCAACVGAPHVRQRLYWMANHAGRSGRGLGACKRLTKSTGGSLANCSGVRQQGSWQLPRSVGATSCARRKADQSVDASWQHSWSTNTRWISCADGKARRTESGILPLAYGLSGCVGRYRAYGNAIVPQVAAVFIKAFLEAEEEV